MGTWSHFNSRVSNQPFPARLVAPLSEFHGTPAAGTRFERIAFLRAGQIGRWMYEFAVGRGEVAFTLWSRHRSKTVVYRGAALYRHRRRWSAAYIGPDITARIGAQSPYSGHSNEAVTMVLRP